MLLYGSFEDKGYRFEAHIPDSDTEPVAFEFRILIGTESKYVLLIPMNYTPTFGVDVGDTQRLESVLDQVLKILPRADQFGAEHVLALDQLDAEIGGKEEQERHHQYTLSSATQIGQFEYTASLFAERFKDFVGGRDAMDRWMETPLNALGGRSPKEALRLGMTQSVIDNILQLPR
jgi:hypothetical protein